MSVSILNLALPAVACLCAVLPIRADDARNPIIHADVPDMAMIRVGDTYYMSSTTMHMSPGLPIMKSRDLVNWQLASYAYDILDDVGELNLDNGRSAYGGGSWASSLRYHNDTFFATTFSGTTNKTYVYTTKDIEKGPWKTVSFRPSLHDHSLFFDDGDGDWNRPGEVTVRDTTSWRERTALRHSGEVLTLAFSPDGKRIAAGGWDGKIRIWRAE